MTKRAENGEKCEKNRGSVGDCQKPVQIVREPAKQQLQKQNRSRKKTGPAGSEIRFSWTDSVLKIPLPFVCLPSLSSKPHSLNPEFASSNPEPSHPHPHLDPLHLSLPRPLSPLSLPKTTQPIEIPFPETPTHKTRNPPTEITFTHHRDTRTTRHDITLAGLHLHHPR